MLLSVRNEVTLQQVDRLRRTNAAKDYEILFLLTFDTS